VISSTKETPTVNTLSTTSPVAAALVLADVLGYNLPEPCSVSVSPWAVNSPYITAVDMQFHGPDKLDALHAWATHFDVTVEMPKPDMSFAHVYFTHSDIRFSCYADVRSEDES
jgi:hypothetical protein